MVGMFEEAEQLERRGDLSGALKIYARLSEQGLGGSEAVIRQALIRRQFGEVNRPVALLEAAARLDPTDPYPYMRLGQLSEGLRRHAVSAGYFEAAAATAPASDEMKVNLSAAYIRLHWYDLAFRTAKAVAPDVGDWWAGARRQGLDTYRERRREALAALRSRPQPLDPDSAWNIALRIAHLGRLKLARKLCEALIAGNPQWFWPVWLIADIIAREEGPDAAIAYLDDSGWSSRGSPEHLEAEARLMLEAGRYEEFMHRLDQRPEVERRGRVYETVVAGLCVAERDEELSRFCADWMEREPKLATPAAFLSMLQVRRTAEAARKRERPFATPARAHLMQFWNAPDVPADVRDTMGSWTRRHPGWEHTVYDAARAEAFLREHLGEETAQAFRLCYHPAMMADMFRIAFLSVAGGFYADADEKCLQPMTGVLPDVNTVEIVAPHSGNMPGHVDNNFIGCRPNNTIGRIVTAGIVEDILRCAQTGERPDIWQATGPGALMRGVAKYLGAGGADASDQVVLLPIQQYRAFVRTEEELGYKRNPAANWRLAALG